MPFSLILASTSVYRQQLLTKLNIPFTSISPDIDETPHKNERAQELVLRLAQQKALAGIAMLDDEAEPNIEQLVIGSDQVAVINNQIVGKPLTEENAIAQLMLASGQAITFYTGLAVINKQSGVMQRCIEPFTVYFKSLTLEQIQYYVRTEQPLYCAGSFKCEGLGIALFEKLQGDDPNSLVGLPLIKLIDLLHLHGLDVLSK